MKKLMLSLALLAGLWVSASAQKEIKFGIKGGASLPNFADGNTSNIISFYLGGTLNVPISDMFSVQPEILFIGKGAKEKNSFSATMYGLTYGKEIDSKINPFYIEVPVNLVANFANRKGSFFVGAGPYYAIGVGGKVKYDGTEINGSETSTVKVDQNIIFGNKKESTMKRGDFGVNFLLGYEWNSGFNIHLGYGWGLKNINNSGNKELKITNVALTGGLGFTF